MFPNTRKNEIIENFYEENEQLTSFSEENISRNHPSFNNFSYSSLSPNEIKILLYGKTGDKKEGNLSKDSPNKGDIFDIKSFDRDTECTKANSIEFDESLFENVDFDLSKTTRSKIRLKRYQSREQILQNIKVNYINKYLIKYLNNILKEEKSILLFEKFPQVFVKNVNKKDNNIILNLTLYDIFVNIDLYKGKKSNQYCYNLKVINYLKNKESKVNKILNTKKYCESYKEYLTSNEYKININKIIRRHKDEEKYIKKFIGLSKRFLDYFEL